MSNSQVTVLGLTFLVLLISSRILKLVRGLKSVDHIPGIRCLFSPLDLPGVLVPNRSWNPGLSWTWYWRSFIYKQYKSETISVVPYILGRPLIYTSSLEVAQQVLGSSLFDKAPENAPLSLWGDNIISANNERNKHHRRIVGPAFSGGIAPLVWRETLKTYNEIVVDEGWSEKNQVSIDCINDYTHKLALIQISRCGFGIPFPWTPTSSLDEETDLDKHILTVSKSIIIRRIVLRWMYRLPIKRLAEVENGFVSLEKYMRTLVVSQRAGVAGKDVDSKMDLLSRLIQANEVEKGKLALSDDELIGNVFAFLLAGHESTARTITSTLALLALHPEEQDIAVEEIRRVLVDGRDPVFNSRVLTIVTLSDDNVLKDINDYNALTKVMACFLEAARLYPVAYILVRDATESVKITTPTVKGDKTYVLASGTRVVVDMTGISYNPRYFPEPDVYKPSRWYGAQESDVNFFGLGPRACVGRKFAMTEGLCFLTVLLRDWAVSPLLRDRETVSEWKSGVMQMEWGITFGMGRVPLKLSRRRL